jgi:hypothetical protein
MMIARCQAKPLMTRLLISLVVFSTLSIRTLVLSLSTVSGGTVHGESMPISGGPCRAHERSSSMLVGNLVCTKETRTTRAAAD